MKRIVLLAALSYSFVATAQKLPQYGVNKVRISEPDKMTVIEIDPTAKPSAETERTYYWYNSNAVHATQGGYSGKLLHGSYQEYYTNKSLKEQGTFHKGLKDGIWKAWNESGVLTEVFSWKNGAKQGAFSQFDAQGQLKQSGTYQHDLLNGKVLIYHGKDSVETVTYKSGVPLKAVTPSPGLWQKVKKFRLRKKATTTTPA